MAGPIGAWLIFIWSDGLWVAEVQKHLLLKIVRIEQHDSGFVRGDGRKLESEVIFLVDDSLKLPTHEN